MAFIKYSKSKIDKIFIKKEIKQNDDKEIESDVENFDELVITIKKNRTGVTNDNN
jgi:hypothetical protein